MMRGTSTLHAAARAAKVELEAPAVGAIARERLVERGARVEMQRPTFGDFAGNRCEGRAGRPTRSGPHTPMLRPTPSRAEAWRIRGSARLLQRYVIDVSCDQGASPSCIRRAVIAAAGEPPGQRSAAVALVMLNMAGGDSSPAEMAWDGSAARRATDSPASGKSRL